MSATHQLLQLYAAWESWTQSETQALRAADWTLLAECQRQKELLQPAIDQLTAQAEQEWRNQESTSGREVVRQKIQALIAMQQANQSILSEQRNCYRQKQAALNTRQFRVARIHRSYSNRRPSTWHTYS